MDVVSPCSPPRISITYSLLLQHLLEKWWWKKISLHSLKSKAIFSGQPWCSLRFSLSEHQMRLKGNQKLFWKCPKILTSSLHSILKKLAHTAAFSGCDLTPFNPDHGSLPVTPLPRCFLQDWQHIHGIKTTPSHLSHFCEPATNEHAAPWSKTSGNEWTITRLVFPRVGQQNTPKTLIAVISGQNQILLPEFREE